MHVFFQFKYVFNILFILKIEIKISVTRLNINCFLLLDKAVSYV